MSDDNEPTVTVRLSDLESATSAYGHHLDWMERKYGRADYAPFYRLQKIVMDAKR